jgi:FkbM family methyltransferase
MKPASPVTGFKRCKLPNGLEVAYQSKVEADYFYRDIFEKQVYVKNGISIEPGDCVFDVGANIGLFTLFVHTRFKDVETYSFEPAPPLFEILKANTTLQAQRANLFNYGMSNSEKTSKFTFYPNSSGMSSFYADVDEEKDVLRSIMVNQTEKGMAGMEQLMRYADELLEERLISEIYECRLTTLSVFLRERNIKKIDLLKIDVQKSELDVGANQTDCNRSP